MRSAAFMAPGGLVLPRGFSSVSLCVIPLDGRASSKAGLVIESLTGDVGLTAVLGVIPTFPRSSDISKFLGPFALLIEVVVKSSSLLSGRATLVGENWLEGLDPLTGSLGAGAPS